MRKRRIASAALLAAFISCSFIGAYIQGTVDVPKGTQTVKATAPKAEIQTITASKAEVQAASAAPKTKIQTITVSKEELATAASKAETQPKKTVKPEQEKLTEEALAAYYGESVFVGDSIMMGFRNYCEYEKSPFANGIQFLTAGSYSAFNAAKPVEGKNVHPMYQGKKRQIWDAIPLMGVKRMFILLGTNDISMLGLERARDQYKEVIDKVLEASPDVEVHILSVTYTAKDKGKGKLNNENIAKYNILLQQMAAENGWGYIDIATPLSDGNGNLAAGNCSDGFVHLVHSAYGIWENVLRDYANEQNKKADKAGTEVTS